MKKKIFNFIIMLCAAIPCSLIMVACGKNPPPDSQPPEGTTSSLSSKLPQNDFWLTRIDATDYQNPEEHIVDDGRYAIWVADYYQKDTLQVVYDDEPISTLTFLDIPEYESKSIGRNVRKIATFSIPKFDPGDHTLNASIEEEELSLKLVSNGQDFSEDELAIMSDWYFVDYENSDLASIIDTDFEMKVSYSKLTNIYSAVNGLTYKSKKTFGYYGELAIFNPVNPEYTISLLETTTAQNYTQTIMLNNFNNDDTFESKEIELTVVKDRLNISTLGVSGPNSICKIFSYYNGDTAMGDPGFCEGWKPTNSNDIKIYINEYPGVDLSNVEVYIYDTKMTLYTDANNDNKKYFVIPNGKLPVEYCVNKTLDAINFTYFDVDIRGIDVSGANLITNFTSTTNNELAETYVDGSRYCNINDTTYYIPNQDVSATFNSNENNIRPSSVILNGTTFDLTDYVYKNSSVPVGDGIYEDPTLQSWKSEDDRFYNYRITIGSKPVLLYMTFEDNGDLASLSIQFSLTGSTTVQYIV